MAEQNSYEHWIDVGRSVLGRPLCEVWSALGLGGPPITTYNGDWERHEFPRGSTNSVERLQVDGNKGICTGLTLLGVRVQSGGRLNVRQFANTYCQDLVRVFGVEGESTACCQQYRGRNIRLRVYHGKEGIVDAIQVTAVDIGSPRRFPLVALSPLDQSALAQEALG